MIETKHLDKLVELTNINSAHRVLLPFTSKGRLLQACIDAGIEQSNLFVYEWHEQTRILLRKRYPIATRTMPGNFAIEEPLGFPKKFARIIIVPPKSHAYFNLRAWWRLASGGVISALVPPKTWNNPNDGLEEAFVKIFGNNKLGVANLGNKIVIVAKRPYR